MAEAGKRGGGTPKSIKPEVKVYLAGEETFFGPGPCRLLGLLKECDSLRVACGQMGLSYSKAWKMIERMEEQLGYKVVERRRGGSERGGTSLTREGKALLEKYAAFACESEAQIQALYKKYFEEDGTE